MCSGSCCKDCGASYINNIFNLVLRQCLICSAYCLSRRAEVCVSALFLFSVSISRHAPTLDLSKKTSTSRQWRAGLLHYRTFINNLYNYKIAWIEIMVSYPPIHYVCKFICKCTLLSRRKVSIGLNSWDV